MNGFSQQKLEDIDLRRDFRGNDPHLHSLEFFSLKLMFGFSTLLPLSEFVDFKELLLVKHRTALQISILYSSGCGQEELGNTGLQSSH